jgi:iron complex transport system substrate-binding protein
MQICSFLPSATEILFALGMGESVAGVTFECDYPPEATLKPVVVNSLLHGNLTPQQIDDAVRKQLAAGGSLYFVDLAQLEAIQPDLVVTQDLCNVCAISAPDLAVALGELASHPKVVSLSPHTLQQVFENVEAVGEAVGRSDEAQSLVRQLQCRVDRIETRARQIPPPRVLCLEWLAPLYQGGHWIPELVTLAGGDPVLATAGEKSVHLSWSQVFDADPEVLILMPCGFHLAETIAQYNELTLPDGWTSISAVKNGRIYAVDGTAYFSRPGPRLVSGLEILAAILHNEPFDHLPAESVMRLPTR